LKYGFYSVLWEEALRRNVSPSSVFKENFLDLMFFLQHQKMNNEIQKELSKDQQ
jgi:hypothetical protein